MSQIHLAEWLELSATIVGRVSSRRGGWAHRAATSAWLERRWVGVAGQGGLASMRQGRAFCLYTSHGHSCGLSVSVRGSLPCCACLLVPASCASRMALVLSRCVGRTSKMAFCELRVIVIHPIQPAYVSGGHGAALRGRPRDRPLRHSYTIVETPCMPTAAFKRQNGPTAAE